MLDKTFRLFDDMMKMFEREVDSFFRHKKGKRTKVKIKAGSTVTINDAIVELINDVYVWTSDPDTLMKIRKFVNTNSLN
jgi:hypothetical protein